MRAPQPRHGEDTSEQRERDAIARADRSEHLLAALCSVLETTDRIMTGTRGLTVRLRETPNAFPAWTDGEAIFLNDRLIRGLFSGETCDVHAAVRIVKGTNYHELAHIIFTPRRGSEFDLKRSAWTGYDYAKLLFWNSIEDQRIETLYTRAFSGTRHYFVAAAMQWLVGNVSGDSIALAYPLLRGRRYLSAEIREKARAAFTNYFPESIVSEVDGLIDKYIATAPSVDPDESLRCVERLYELLLGSRGSTWAGSALYKVFDSATSCRSALEKGDVDAEAEALAINELGKEIGSQDDWSGVIKWRRSSGIRNEESDGSSGEGEDGWSAADVLEAARAALRDALLNALVASEINQTQRALQATMDRLTGPDKEVVRPTGATRRPAPAALIVWSNRLAQKLRGMRDDLEPVLVHDLPAGKLNIPRAIRYVAHGANLDIFDRYEAGFEDDAEVEVVMLLDISMSMKPQIDQAAAAMWILKRALDCVEVRSTVYGFGTRAYLLYGPTERAGKRELLTFPASDGLTRPFEAVRMAYRTLRRSECPSKLFVVITDGQWGGQGAETPEACDHMIASMRATGTKTVLFTLGGAVRLGGHNCEFVYAIKSPEQVVEAMEVIVAKALAGAAA